MGTLGRTWQLYKQSFRVLTADSEILVFPVLSTVGTLMLAAGFFVPLHRAGLLAGLEGGASGAAVYGVLFLWYFLNVFLVVFFNSALVACADIRLSGGDPTLADGLRVAVQRLDRIVAWAFVAATVGVLLRALANRPGLLVRLLGAGLSVGWALVTYLIVPVLVIEDVGVISAIERSAALFRKHWGEQIAGTFGFGVLNLLLCLPGLLLGALLFRIVDAAAGIIVGGVYLLVLATVLASLRGIFTVALYRFAVDGVPPYGFAAESLTPAWRALSIR